jgi:hypothetical protein
LIQSHEPVLAVRITTDVSWLMNLGRPDGPSVSKRKAGYLSDLNSLSSFQAPVQASLEFFLFSCAHLRQHGVIKRYLLTRGIFCDVLAHPMAGDDLARPENIGLHLSAANCGRARFDVAPHRQIVVDRRDHPFLRF